MTKACKVLCAALALAILAGLTGCAAAAAPSAAQSEQTVTVSAVGTVRLTPDRAAVSFGVTSREDTAALAQSKNAEAVDRVIGVLTDRGVEEKSIRTANYYLYPQYDWSETGEQRIIGYVAATTLTVSDQELAGLGTLLSACVEAGVNQIDNVSFLCSGYDEAYRQALAQAVEAARDKADALARAAGRTLGEPITLLEGWQDTSARYRVTAGMAFSTAEAAMDAGGPDFQPGETEIQANVTVTYRMG